MPTNIILNDTLIYVENYNHKIEAGLQQICVDFKVTTEDYHDITTLLYKGIFEVKVPVMDVAFKGAIKEYSTSITNLYEKGRVGDFKLCLQEVN